MPEQPLQSMVEHFLSIESVNSLPELSHLGYTQLTGLEVFYVAISIARHGDLTGQIALIGY
jgi:hypothetical protein